MASQACRQLAVSRFDSGPRFPMIRVRNLRADLTGQRFGRLLVLASAPRRNRWFRWSCRCDCGTEHVTTARDLVGGYTKSCGCIKREASRRNMAVANAARLSRHASGTAPSNATAGCALAEALGYNTRSR